MIKYLQYFASKICKLQISLFQFPFFLHFDFLAYFSSTKKIQKIIILKPKHQNLEWIIVLIKFLTNLQPFCFIFIIKNLCRHFFRFLKKIDPNGPYIGTFQTILRNVCLSIILELCLLSSSSLALSYVSSL